MKSTATSHRVKVRVSRSKSPITSELIEKAKGRGYLQFHVKSEFISGGSHVGFSQREYEGFRGCREYDKKRIVMASEKAIALFTYDVINPQKIFKLLEWTPNEEGDVQILHAGFLEDMRPNVLLVAMYNESTNVSTLKLMKIKSLNKK